MPGSGFIRRRPYGSVRRVFMATAAANRGEIAGLARQTTNLGALIAERISKDVGRSIEQVAEARARLGQLVHRLSRRQARQWNVRQAVRAELHALLPELANPSRVEQTLLAFFGIPRVGAADLTGDEEDGGRHPSRAERRPGVSGRSRYSRHRT
jgi:hypothetical protein